jgi:uncharacterized protein
MKISIEKPDQSDLKKRGVYEWPIWEKEVSKFDWHYDQIEECYLLEGHVIVEYENGKIAEFGKGDFVTFQKDLSCVWEVKQPVKKHYNFK